MTPFDPNRYGPACAELLADVRRCEIDAGTPNEHLRSKLANFDAHQLVPGGQIHDAKAAAGCLAGLWLIHNFLDESHRISQDIETPSGSFWHGIMHRREGDYSNAKYWFRRVGTHPIFEDLAAAAAHLARNQQPTSSAAQRVASGGRWDPMAMVDWVSAAVRGGDADRALCEQIAFAEWQLLFDDCYERARGPAV